MDPFKSVSNWWASLGVGVQKAIYLLLLVMVVLMLVASAVEPDATEPSTSTPVVAAELPPEPEPEPEPTPEPTQPAVVVVEPEPEPDVDEALEAEISQFIIDTGAASITIQTSGACDEDTLLLMADWINRASASVRRFTALLESGTPSQIATIQADYPTISTIMNELNSNAETHLNYCQTLLGP